jgi:hypothetical protein
MQPQVFPEMIKRTTMYFVISFLICRLILFIGFNELVNSLIFAMMITGLILENKMWKKTLR